jgi:hypothetical protein
MAEDIIERLSAQIQNSLARFGKTERECLHKTHEVVIDRNMNLSFEPIGTTSTYRQKKDGKILIPIPAWQHSDEFQALQIALAVGKRIERFERGLKINSNRTPISRKKISQNAIQTRWNAK